MVDKIYYIYKVTNLKTDKSYIGFTQNFKTRKGQHKYAAFCRLLDTPFYNAIRKYGWDSFDWMLIYGSKDKDHIHKEMESYFIKYYNTKNNGYNLTNGGEGSIGFKFSKRQKLESKERNKKSHNNPATIEKIRLNSTNISEETRRKRSEAAKRQWADPLMRIRTTKGSTKHNKRKDKRLVISIKAKKRWSSKTFRKKMDTIYKNLPNKPELNISRL